LTNPLIIYPRDPTTTFLLDPFNFLQKKLNQATFYIIEPNDDSHNECLQLIDNFETIIFMGHGSSHNLSGAKGENYDKGALISNQQIRAGNLKNWILFSCNSNDLLSSCSTNVNGIGFGDLPTDFNDIWGIREFDWSAYPKITSEIIEAFKDSINWIISKSVVESVENKMSIQELFNFIRILITKRMVDILKDPKNIEQKELAKLLFDMKYETRLVSTI
jgi:hypothetical protein